MGKVVEIFTGKEIETKDQLKQIQMAEKMIDEACEMLDSLDIENKDSLRAIEMVHNYLHNHKKGINNEV